MSQQEAQKRAEEDFGQVPICKFWGPASQFCSPPAIALMSGYIFSH